MAQVMWPLNGPNEQRGGADSAQVDRVAPLLSGKGMLHHLGFVVSSISAVAEQFAASTAARWDGEVIHDPIQRVRVAFFSPADSQIPVLELVEPASEVSPVNDFLKKRGGFHHVCYEIDDLASGLREAWGAGLVIVADPAPAVAFGGRRIAWVQFRRWMYDAKIREQLGMPREPLKPLPMFPEDDCSRRRLLVELLERNRK
jgi:methylmalonyl-CoA/ethylmalonyl-CoA epimerase